MAPYGSGGLGSTKRPHASKHWCFTLNNYTEDEVKDIIGSNTKRFVFQEEIGEKGTPHLQGYIELPEKGRPMESFDNKRIHWEKTRSAKASIKYCSKEETRSGKIYTKGVRIPKKIKIIKDLYIWQERIVEMLKHEPDDRTIYWYWDREGNIGKSALCKYLAVNNDALVISGSGKDMKYLVTQYEKSNGVYPEIIIIDIPRTAENYISWTGIESIKNGLFASTKYECEMVVMNSPHIVCFANFEPNMDVISRDRWEIRNL